MTNAVAAAVLAVPTPPIAATTGPVVFTLKDFQGNTVSTQTIGAGPADLTASATFTAVAPGTSYTVSAQRVDASGAAVGPLGVSDPFNIVVTQDVTVVTGVTVSVA